MLNFIVSLFIYILYEKKIEVAEPALHKLTKKKAGPSFSQLCYTVFPSNLPEKQLFSARKQFFSMPYFLVLNFNPSLVVERKA